MRNFVTKEERKLTENFPFKIRKIFLRIEKSFAEKKIKQIFSNRFLRNHFFSFLSIPETKIYFYVRLCQVSELFHTLGGSCILSVSVFANFIKVFLIANKVKLFKSFKTLILLDILNILTIALKDSTLCVEQQPAEKSFFYVTFCNHSFSSRKNPSAHLDFFWETYLNNSSLIHQYSFSEAILKSLFETHFVLFQALLLEKI